jgi:hypothetical protein
MPDNKAVEDWHQSEFFRSLECPDLFGCLCGTAEGVFFQNLIYATSSGQLA